ncbi:MAG: tyrosine-type recombinase/integrase [Chloroflexi bacterium]|nr:tyrosine-type recombinase/integrase [Chloroflexota bacterium]
MRPVNPSVSTAGQDALDQYGYYLTNEEDLSGATVRNYLSDLRHFVAWCEATWEEGQDIGQSFTPPGVSTPTITRYRSYLQTVLRLKPASINRALVTLKRYFSWAVDTGLVMRNPASVVKLVAQVAQPPRQLTDTEEEALVAAVTAGGNLRDRTIIVLMLHTGLRAREVCTLKPYNVRRGKRSGSLQVVGKRNKYREVPLNVTVRAALAEYLPALAQGAPYLFPSGKTGEVLTERALGHLVKKYARAAHLTDVSPHDLRHRFGYRMAESVPLHRLAQIMGHDSLDTTMIYVRGTRSDLQKEVEKIAWS